MEDLIYRRLLDLYYLHERPLNDDATTVAKLIGLRDEAASVRDVLNEFFQKTDDGYRSDRADKEIAHYHSKIEQASRAGKASAERRLNDRSTDVQPNNNQEPITKNHKPNIKKEPLALVPDWLSLETWNAFVEMRKKIKKPMTEYAMKLLLGKLTKMKEAGVDVDLALQNSILHGWQDVYEPKKVEHPVAGKQLINGRDPTLIQLEQDFKKATPMPSNIREMMKGVVKTI